MWSKASYQVKDMILKKHNQDGKLILALCDTEILGKVYEEGNKQLDLSKEFFKGTESDDESIKKLLPRAYLINAVGKYAIEFLRSQNLIDEDNVITIAGTPSAQVLLQ